LVAVAAAVMWVTARHQRAAVIAAVKKAVDPPDLVPVSFQL
jgi:hypothetical protein